MYESLRARAHRARDALNAPNVAGVMRGVFEAVREAADGDGGGVRAVCVPDGIARLGKRLGIPLFTE